MSFLPNWLVPGRDRQLAADAYSGRESASDTARRKRLAAHHRNATKADRAGWRWADQQRERQDHRRRRG